jgi:hypothetical protein
MRDLAQESPLEHCGGCSAQVLGRLQEHAIQRRWARGAHKNLVGGPTTWPIHPMSVGTTDRVKDDPEEGLDGSRVQGRTGDSRPKAKDGLSCLLDQLNAVDPRTQPLRPLPGPTTWASSVKRDRRKPPPATAARRDGWPSWPDVRRKAVGFFVDARWPTGATAGIERIVTGARWPSGPALS